VKVIEPFSPNEMAAEADSDSGDDDAGSSSLHKTPTETKQEQS